jgi:SAM-dependent methyltransferase
VENLPFGDDSFDVVLSRFGYMFASHPEVAIKEMLRVTKSGGCIAFATWPPEHANGKLFDVMTKHVTFCCATRADTASATAIAQPPWPMQWGIPEITQKRLGVGKNVKNIHFERGAIYKPILSPNHYWKMAITKGGTLIQAIQTIKDPKKAEDLKKDIMQAITP